MYRTGFTGNVVVSEDSSDEQVALALAVVAVFKDFRTILQYDIF